MSDGIAAGGVKLPMGKFPAPISELIKVSYKLIVIELATPFLVDFVPYVTLSCF